MRLQQLRDRIFLCLLLGRNIQVRDAAIQIVQQLQRILAVAANPGAVAPSCQPAATPPAASVRRRSTACSSAARSTRKV
jgi:hypothetical protein